MILYRAASGPRARRGAAFSPDKETAAAYTDNPGFGGSEVFKFTVDPEKPMKLFSGRDPGGPYEVKELAYWFAENNELDPLEVYDRWGDRGLWMVYAVLESDRRVVEALRKFDYDWISYTDDFPDGAETWVYLGDDVLVGRAVKFRKPRRRAR